MVSKPFLSVFSLVEIIEDGSDDNDEVFNIRYSVEKVGSNAGQVLVSEITAREHMDNGRLVLIVGHIDDPRCRLELEVGDEIVAKYFRLLFKLFQVGSLG